MTDKKINEQPFEVRRGDSIHLTGGKLICSVGPSRRVPEERQEGESWLDMMNRTQSQRDAIQAETEERAAAICSFLNLQQEKE